MAHLKMLEGSVNELHSTTMSWLSLKAHPPLMASGLFWSVNGSYQVSPHSLHVSQSPSPSPSQHWLKSSHTPSLLALTLEDLWSSLLNTYCWLVVEVGKKALGVFIVSLVYQNNTNPPPHQVKQKSAKQTFGFTSQGKYKSVQTFSCQVG